MRSLLLNTLAAALLLALPFTVTPEAASAQQAAQECTLEVAPQDLSAGEEAVQVDARFSQEIGEVSDVQIAGASGIALASPETIERSEMARAEEAEQEAGEPQAIEMSREANSATLWLNLSEAEPGTHEVTVIGENGSCTGTVTVNEGR